MGNLFARSSVFFAALLSLTLTILAFLLYKNVNGVMLAWGNTEKALVYLKVDATDSEKTKLAEEIKSLDPKFSVEAINREESIKNFKATLPQYAFDIQNDEEILDLVPEVLAVGYEDSQQNAEKTNAFEKLKNNLRNHPFVDEVAFSFKDFKAFYLIKKIFNSFGLWLVITLSVGMASLLFFAMRLFVAESKNEIEVYSLLGATKWQIYKKYFLKAAVFSLVTVFIAVISSYLFFIKLKNVFNNRYFEIVFLNSTEITTFFVCMLFFIIGISFFSIQQSVKKMVQLGYD